MAQNGAKQPLFSGLIDPTAQTNQSNAPKRKRFSCCGAESDGNDSLPHSESIPGKPRPRPNFKRVAMFFSAYLSIGTACFHLIRDQMKGKKTDGVLDSVYFCVVTMTTVGYGDLVPNTVTSKLLSCGFVFTGMTIVGMFLSGAAEYLVQKQEILLVKAFHVCRTADPKDIVEKNIKTNRVKYKCLTVFIFLVLLMMGGTVMLATVEKFGVVDAFYCVCTTITTLGYGDMSFGTKAGRTFAIFWILTGTGSLAQFFFYVAELRTEHRQKELVKWVLARKLTPEDLEAADLDKNRDVEPAEFILLKLKEMGKISEEDVTPLMEEFERRDIDKNKKLTVSDISLAQLSQTGK